ncbi:MAG: glycosyltransferase family 2 protein [bacterium]|nr:glycosyltransferase family 2 protein [bacterium]
MQPFVSIILPVRNEEQYIINCLDSIAAQDYPHDLMELLIVDGLSDDDTLEQIAEFDSRYDEFPVTILPNPKQAVSSARNIAIKKAVGDVIVCMDAHALYSPDYISSCVQVMEATGAATVGGHMRALPANDTALARASVLANDSPFGLGGGRFHDPNYEGLVETVWMGCYKKEALYNVGLYDERRTRTEDIDLNRRLIEAGYKIYLSPMIKAWYYPRSKFTDLWRQRWADGFEITRFLPDNPKAPRLRHFIPLIFVSSLILLTALSLSGLGAALWGHGAGTKLANALHGLKGFGLKQPGVLDQKSWSWHLLFLRLLALELGAYLGAMALAVIQAGRSQYKVHKVKKAESVTRDEVHKVEKVESVKLGEDTSEPEATSPGLSTLGLSDFRPAPGSLLLLPAVFLTLHVSYGLGSLWGLATLPFWLGTNQKT